MKAHLVAVAVSFSLALYLFGGAGLLGALGLYVLASIIVTPGTRAPRR